MTQNRTWQPEAPIPLNTEGARITRAVQIGEEFGKFALQQLCDSRLVPSRLREADVVLTVKGAQPQMFLLDPRKLSQHSDNIAMNRAFAAQALGQLVSDKLSNPRYYPEAGLQVRAMLRLDDGLLVRTLEING